jgi:septum formation protein
MLILASQSPRRAALLDQVGVAFATAPAAIDERVAPAEQAGDYVRRIAIEKARAVRERHPGDAVLGADTAVVLDRRIFGKPADRADATRMLLALSGRTHEVLTGVALVTERTAYALSVSRVSFRTIREAEAEAYWASGEPVDKAGGYAIQGLGAAFVERIEGSYSGIMGLPLFETLALLRTIGVRSGIGV